MDKRVYRFIQSLIVLGLAAYLMERWISGRLSYYINLRFSPLTGLAIVLLAVMAVVALKNLFKSEENGAALLGENKKPGKLNANLIVLLLIPIIVAMFGLSASVIVSTFILIVLLGGVRLLAFHQNEHEVNGAASEISLQSLLILSIPLILGVFVPARALNVSSLDTKAISLSAPASLGQQPVKMMNVTPDDRNVLDWVKLFNYEKNWDSYLGQPANVIGFVYHDSRLKPGQFMVGRFAITCCVADAFAIGMVVDWPESETLTANSWVNVKGTIDAIEIDGQKEPLIHAGTVTPINPPDQPYLYP